MSGTLHRTTHHARDWQPCAFRNLKFQKEKQIHNPYNWKKKSEKRRYEKEERRNFVLTLAFIQQSNNSRKECTQERSGTKSKTSLEKTGIDPVTSRMRNGRSTI